MPGLYNSTEIGFGRILCALNHRYHQLCRCWCWCWYSGSSSSSVRRRQDERSRGKKTGVESNKSVHSPPLPRPLPSRTSHTEKYRGHRALGTGQDDQPWWEDSLNTSAKQDRETSRSASLADFTEFWPSSPAICGGSAPATIDSTSVDVAAERSTPASGTSSSAGLRFRRG